MAKKGQDYLYRERFITINTILALYWKLQLIKCYFSCLPKGRWEEGKTINLCMFLSFSANMAKTTARPDEEFMNES